MPHPATNNVPTRGLCVQAVRGNFFADHCSLLVDGISERESAGARDTAAFCEWPTTVATHICWNQYAAS